MSHLLLKRQALLLRSLGKSYSQIKSEIGVSKSTLSDWLRKYPLSKEQLFLLNNLNETRIEKFRETMKLKREKKLYTYYKKSKEELPPLSNRELFLCGLFLYWGEGGKTSRGTLSISNTDPAIVKFSMYWIEKALNVPREKISVLLHIYKDMNIEESIAFWSKALHIPKNQFVKPYIKVSKREELDEKGYGHGTCMLRVYNTVIKDTVLMSLKVMGDYAEEYISNL